MTRRFPRYVAYSLAAGLLTAGTLAGVGSAASADETPTAQAGLVPTAADQAAAIARNAIKQLMIGSHGTNQQAGIAGSVNGITKTNSNNWAGYADTGSDFTKVSASWTEPSAGCGLDFQSLAAFWVGLDGFKSSSVEQDGTLIECYLGTEYQYTWWEMYPNNQVQTVGGAVQAGDRITSTVARSGTSYTLTVTDSTHPANSFTTKQSSTAAANSSAEWIAEAPSGNFGVYPLTNFGTWNATNAIVSRAGGAADPVSSFNDSEISLIDSSGLTQAQPSALSSSGNAFSVTWQSGS
jgi:hypothetical protein